MEPLQIQCVDDLKQTIPHRFLVPKFDETNQQQVIQMLYQRFHDFNINGDHAYNDMWELALDTIGLTTPEDALELIEELHLDYQGEADNETRYLNNLKLLKTLRDEAYVEIPIEEELTQHAPLENGLDVDTLYISDVAGVIEELNESLRDAYADYTRKNNNSADPFV